MLKKSKIGKMLLGRHHFILTSYKQKRPHLKGRIFLQGAAAGNGVARTGKPAAGFGPGALGARGDRGRRAVEQGGGRLGSGGQGRASFANFPAFLLLILQVDRRWVHRSPKSDYNVI
jgi:hypothetical protein